MDKNSVEMITKTNSKGVRISKRDNDILEIENNLNLEILRKKKQEMLKTEKRIDIVIQEAPEDLESETKIYNFDSDGEEEKVRETYRQDITARSGTEYIQFHQELRHIDGDKKKLKIPYVRKKTFLKAQAKFAQPNRKVASLTFNELNNPVVGFRFALTIDGPSFLPVKQFKDEPKSTIFLRNSEL